MVRTRNQAKGKLPRRGPAPHYSGSGILSNPVHIDDDDTSRIIMDPVPISRVPFQTIQEHQSASSGNPELTIDLFGKTLDHVPNLGKNPESNTGVLGHGQEPCPSSLDIPEKDLNRSSGQNHETEETHYQEIEESHSLEPNKKRLKRTDPYEGGDPRAKRPDDFPIRAGPPQRQPTNPPPRLPKSKIAIKRGSEPEEDLSWASEEHPDNDVENIVQEKRKPTRKGKQKKKGKGKVSPADDQSTLPKPHSTKFLSQQSANLWSKVIERKILSQKLLLIDKLNKHDQIREILTKNHLLGSVTNIEAYDEQVVQEFYSNLTKDITISTSPMYGKIYLRGKYYEFNPDIINNHINTTEGEERILLANDEVNQELTAGNVNLEKNKIKAASLTSKYAVLQKIALANWMPSLHESTLKRSLADLLYKIGKGIKVDLGNLIYTQVTNLAENKGTKACLIFPNLICSVLAKQGLKIHKPTLFELEASEKHVLRKQMEIKEEKIEVQQWLKALKLESNENEENEEGDQEPEDDQENEENEENEEEDFQEPEAESSENST
ncbi:PREDICTED: uncharacterized protein LOC109150835 [Ipomoea nil]|uniref:uncharacterized protein LOC109150835 n=1 Tax=Ipomoea nil TaxID=35883 RepID=UPI0009010BBB|nr:PREDICTED: uncharacterized protein LOC109150835 [Ipomoea nil]